MAKSHRIARRAAKLAAQQAAKLAAQQAAERTARDRHFILRVAEIKTMNDVEALKIRGDYYAENYGPDNPVTMAAEDRIEFLQRPSEREARLQFLLDWARELSAQGETRTFDDVIDHLHANGFVSGFGTPYVKGTRGIASCIHATYRYAHDELGLGDEGAACVADSFTKPDGAYAYA